MFTRNKIKLANLPTPIQKLDYDTSLVNVFIKRDDYTGCITGGNKIRKLEYVLKDCIDTGHQAIITCGGLQSNHCRATVAACRKLGLEPYLLLAGEPTSTPSGNLFLDLLGDAHVCYISQKDYQEKRNKLMEEWQESLANKNTRAYIIPEGASSGIGSHGYYEAYQEIKSQEKELNISFSHIVVATGSGGTCAGLYLASQMDKNPKTIVGVNIYDNDINMKDKVADVLSRSTKELYDQPVLGLDDLKILNGYAGLGYAKSSPKELTLLQDIFLKTGILLDRVYTIKAFIALLDAIRNSSIPIDANVLFIHTGGQWGNLADTSLFSL